MTDGRPGAADPVAPGPRGNLRQAALRGILWTSAQRWGAEAIETVTYVVLARMLLPQAFGLIAIARVFTSLAQLLVESGLESAIVQRQDLRRSHLDTAFWLNVAVGASLTVFGLVGAGAVTSGLVWMGNALYGAGAGAAEADAVEPLLRALSVSFLLSSVCGVPTALYRRALRFDVLAVRNWCGSLVGGGVGVVLALNGAGVWSLVWMQLAVTAVSVPILWIRSTYRPGFALSASSLRELFGFGVHIFAMRLVDFATTQADRLVVGSALGASQLGFLTLGQRVAVSLSRVLAQTVGGVVLPTFARVHGDAARLNRGYLEALHVLTLATVPGFVGVAATSADLVTVLFGDAWAPAVPVVQVLAVIGLFHALSFINGPVIMSTGRTGVLLVVATIAAVVKLGALLVAGRYGIVAVSAVAAVEVVIHLPVQLAILGRIAGLRARDYLHAVVPALIAGLLAAAAALGVRHLLPDAGPVGRLCAQLAAGALVYAAVLPLVDMPGIRRIRGLVELLRDRSGGSGAPPDPARDRPPTAESTDGSPSAPGAGAAPAVSVVIPTFDRAGCIGDAVRSALGQSFRDAEVIVVDDGSADDTSSVLAGFGPSIRVIRQEHRGVSAARNAGVRAARGKWIAFLDSDDVWHPEKLEVQLRDLGESPGAVAHLCGVQIESRNGDVRTAGAAAGDDPSADPRAVARPLGLVVEWRAFLQAWVVRRDVLLGLPPFDESRSIFEDFPVAGRVALAGPWVVRSRPLVRVRRVASPGLSDLAVTQPAYALGCLAAAYRAVLALPGLERSERAVLGRRLAATLTDLAELQMDAGRWSARAGLFRALAANPRPGRLAVVLIGLVTGAAGLRSVRRSRRGGGFRRTDLDAPLPPDRGTATSGDAS